jgi:hypothetical protein
MMFRRKDSWGHTTLQFTAATPPTKVAATLRHAVRSWTFAGILGGRHMECAYYFTFVAFVSSSRKQKGNSIMTLLAWSGTERGISFSVRP